MAPISAVVTTGIYCRPDCSARPLPRNVRDFDLAASAEAAGFRACLRCRPYRNQISLGSVGPEVVCRAVKLIIDGALDDGNEAELGQRLGVSPRHLRRQFNDHLGVTPDQLARSRRAHFARRMLDDSDLTVTEIAFAAGFGSVRQLNRATAELFQAAPLELRSRRRKADRLVADGGLVLRLEFQPPLSPGAMFDFLAARAIDGVESVTDSSYRRTVLIGGDPGVLEVHPGGHDHLLLKAHLPHWDGLIHVVQQVRRLFNLDLDIQSAERTLKSDPLMARLIRSRPGLRIPGAWDPIEVAVRAVIGQQISVAGASTITSRLVARHGRPVPGLAEFGLSRLFPTVEQLAEADLAGLGLTDARQRTIRALASAVIEGVVSLDGRASLGHLLQALTALPGIGPWTAGYLAMRLGEPDAFPTDDLGLIRALRRATDSAISGRDLSERAELWRPFRAHAVALLWSA